MNYPHPRASFDFVPSHYHYQQPDDPLLRANQSIPPHHLLQHHQPHLSHQTFSPVASSEIPAAELNPTTSLLLPRIATRMRQLPHEQRASDGSPSHTATQLLSRPFGDIGTPGTLAEFSPRSVISPKPRVRQMRVHVKILCSFGGRIMARPVDGKLQYCGGETRIISLDRNVSYLELLRNFSELYGKHITLKYQLPGEDMDALISISCEDDLQNLFDEYEKLRRSDRNLWLRIFIFSDPSECEIIDCCISPRAMEDYTEEIQRYVDAINGISVRMQDMHLEDATNDVTSHRVHEKGNPAYFYAANPLAKAGHSVPSSPPRTLRETHHNPQNMIDMSHHTWKESENSLSPEALEDPVANTFRGSPVLQRDVKFLRVEIKSSDPKGILPRLCECCAVPYLVADKRPDLRDPFGRPPPQAHWVKHHGNHVIQNFEDPQQCCQSEIHRQHPNSHLQNQGFPEFHCVECNVRQQCSMDQHEISTSVQADFQKLHIQSMTNCYPSSISTWGPYSRCSYHPSHSQVHRGVNVSLAEHKQNRILSHSDDRSTRNSGVLSYSSRFQNGIEHYVDSNAWQHHRDLEEQEQLANLRKNAFLKDSSLFHLGEVSGKEHVSHNPQCAYSEFPFRPIQRHKYYHCCIDFNDKQILQPEKNVHANMHTENSQGNFGEHEKPNYLEMCSASFPAYSHPFQDSHSDEEFTKENLFKYNILEAELESNSRDPFRASSRHGGPQKHPIPATQTSLVDNIPNFSLNGYGFSTGCDSIISADAIVRSPFRTLLQQHEWYDDPYASVNSKPIPSRNENSAVVLKEEPSELIDKGCISESTSFGKSSHIGEENVLKDSVDFGSYTETPENVGVSEEATGEGMELMNIPPFTNKLTESCNHMFSTPDINIAGHTVDTTWFSGSSQSLLLAWNREVPNGTFSRTDQKQDESSATFASPIYDQSPTSSIATGSMLFECKEEASSFEKAKYANDNMCCIEKHSNGMISSGMDLFSNEIPGGKILGAGQDSIEKHCDKIFGKGLRAISGNSISFLHSDGHWSTEAETNANIWKASFGHPQVLSGLSYEGKKSDSFCIHELKKRSSVIEAEAEAIARGLQIIKHDDLEELRELGSGTYGTVFHGKWKGTDVAIKRLKSSCFMGDPSVQERLILEFWSEAAMLSQLHHPNIVAFYGVVPDGPEGTLATVTEYMVNGSLKQVLVKDRTLDQMKRLLIAMDAAFGMEYLHNKNVVHFDLKSENLLVNMRDVQRPVCKVGDFGLSKVKHYSLVSGGIRGTLPWMAPELLNEKSSMVTEKIDVYSFGIVMWELLTGEEPYANMQCDTIIGGIVNNSLRPPIPSGCDPNWKELMEHCWSADPADRPTFSVIASELRAMAAAMKIK